MHLIYNAVLLFDFFVFLQQSDSVIHIYVHILFFNILFHYGLLQDVEDNSLCYTVGTCLSIRYILIIAYIC